MAIDAGGLLSNIFLATLVIAQFQIALIAVFYTLLLQSGEQRYKKAIRMSVISSLWFFVLAIIALGIEVFSNAIDSLIPRIFFVLILLGTALIAWTMIAVAGWRIVDSFPDTQRGSPEVVTLDLGRDDEKH